MLSSGDKKQEARLGNVGSLLCCHSLHATADCAAAALILLLNTIHCTAAAAVCTSAGHGKDDRDTVIWYYLQSSSCKTIIFFPLLTLPPCLPVPQAHTPRHPWIISWGHVATKTAITNYISTPCGIILLFWLKTTKFSLAVLFIWAISRLCKRCYYLWFVFQTCSEYPDNLSLGPQVFQIHNLLST